MTRRVFAAKVTAKPNEFTVVPPAVVAVNICVPTGALGEIIKLAVIVVAVDTTDEKVIPVRVLIVPPVKLVPVRVTGTVAPCLPVEGDRPVSVGIAGTTVKVRLLVT